VTGLAVYRLFVVLFLGLRVLAGSCRQTAQRAVVEQQKKYQKSVHGRTGRHSTSLTLNGHGRQSLRLSDLLGSLWEGGGVLRSSHHL